MRNGFRCEVATAKVKAESTVNPSRLYARETGSTVDRTVV